MFEEFALDSIDKSQGKALVTSPIRMTSLCIKVMRKEKVISVYL